MSSSRFTVATAFIVCNVENTRWPVIAAAVHGIVAQRLVRQVCSDCAQAYEPDAHQLAWLRAQVGAEHAESIAFQVGTGCTYCNLSGYRGRVAIYELLEIDRPLADAISRNDLIGFASAARARPGYVSLTQSALELAAKGVTTLAEVIGVTSGLDDAPARTAAPSTPQAVNELTDAILRGVVR